MNNNYNQRFIQLLMVIRSMSSGKGHWLKVVIIAMRIWDESRSRRASVEYGLLKIM